MTERLLQDALTAKGFTVTGGTDAKYFDPADIVTAPDGNIIYIPKDAACFDETERQLQNILAGGGSGVISCANGRYVFKDYKVIEKPPVSWIIRFNEAKALYQKGSRAAAVNIWTELYGNSIRSASEKEMADIALAISTDLPGLELEPDVYYRLYDRLITTISSRPDLLGRLTPSILLGMSNSAMGLKKTDALFIKLEKSVSAMPNSDIKGLLLQLIDKLWPSDEELD